MYMLHTASEFINEVFEDHETAKAKAEQIAKEKSIIVYIFKAKEAIEIKAISTKITEKKKVISIEKPKTLSVFVGSSQSKVLEIELEKLSVDHEPIAPEKVVINNETIPEEQKDIPLYLHIPEELIKEVEISERTYLEVKESDLFFPETIQEVKEKSEAIDQENFVSPNQNKKTKSNIDINNIDSLSIIEISKKRDEKYLNDMELLDLAQQAFEECLSVPSLVETFKKYQALEYSELSNEYKNLKNEMLETLLESDLMRELINVTNEKDLGDILGRYPDHIKSKNLVIDQLDRLNKKFEKNDNSYDSKIENKTDEQLKKDIEQTFDTCNTVALIASSKNRLKIEYPELENSTWFIQMYYEYVNKLSSNKYLPLPIK